MRIGSSKELKNETLTALGKISAASDWRGAEDGLDANVSRLKALHQLMRAAEDYDADALLDVDYTEEVLARAEFPGAAPLKRVCASAIAVKLKSA
ncbi:MAG TPA: hypothetical protein VMU18_13220 [Rhodoblastus sp.]|nr:hypothetical protein [Rhodoblastus sp.]